VSVLDLPPTTDSVPAARRFVRSRLSDADIDVDTAILLVSEVVTNAVLHARTALTLTVENLGAVAHIEVRDGSPVLPRVHAFSTTSATGRGLRLLEQLAMRWGFDQEPSTGGKTVWFEVGAVSEQAWAAFAFDEVEDEWLVEGVSNEH
jgi:hypothetical protein